MSTLTEVSPVMKKRQTVPPFFQKDAMSTLTEASPVTKERQIFWTPMSSLQALSLIRNKQDFLEPKLLEEQNSEQEISASMH
jgi:hypothetical protein